MTAERYSVQIKLERGYLDGTVLAPKTAVPGVLFVHGWGAAKSSIWSAPSRRWHWAAFA
ncbi:MAG: Hydrolases of the alpha/beta superfamily [uncultured Paraburkholderia sp.]|nr:MAG: Hydrolases of the alpha/beta superfamily [uncultured Paraburkholderia sp.]